MDCSIWHFVHCRYENRNIYVQENIIICHMSSSGFSYQISVPSFQHVGCCRSVVELSIGIFTRKKKRIVVVQGTKVVVQLGDKGRRSGDKGRLSSEDHLPGVGHRRHVCCVRPFP